MHKTQALSRYFTLVTILFLHNHSRATMTSFGAILELRNAVRGVNFPGKGITEVHVSMLLALRGGGDRCPISRKSCTFN